MGCMSKHCASCLAERKEKIVEAFSSEVTRLLEFNAVVRDSPQTSN